MRLALDGNGTCNRIPVGITGVTDKAHRAERVEQMLKDKQLDASAIGQPAREATRNVEVIEDINGSSEYRKHLTEVRVVRAIESALKG